MANTMVIGASADSPEENKAWKEKEGFPFPLISDPKRVLSSLYGDEVRWACFIDEEGKVKVYCSQICGDEKAFNEKFFFASEILNWA